MNKLCGDEWEIVRDLFSDYFFKTHTMKRFYQKLSKRTILSTFLVLFSMANFAATYYVSNAGNDSNSGLSSTQSWQSLNKVNGASLVAGDVVLFKSSDTWYGALRPKSGNSSAPITFGAYDTGEKPLIHASVNLNNASDWTQDGTNIWRTTRTFSSDIGNIIFNNDAAVGFKKWTKATISSQGHFYYDTSNQNVYLYSVGNPTLKYTNIKLALSIPLVDIWDKDYITVENLAFKYTGGHGFGIGESSNIIVRNCDIGWIGGGRLGGSTSQVRYGNGVEFWANTSKCRVERCKVWEIYDAALTNQSTEVCTQTNIVYTNNIIWNSEYSFEYFSRPSSSTTSNIQFTNNTCYNAGSGWAHSQRPDPSGNHIQIWDFVAPVSGFTISNNIFEQATKYIYYFPQLTRPTSTISVDYNTVYTNGVIAFMAGANYSASQFATYKSATGWDANSLNANPLMVNASGSNFSLSSNSPSIDTGNPVSPVDQDGTRADMGALYYNHSLVIASPAAYAVTGGGVCLSPETGVPVGLNNSQTGINYQVKLGGVNNGSAVTGTGSALSFGNKSTAGVYTVTATNVSTSASATMTGSATVTVDHVVTNPTTTLITGVSVSPVSVSIAVNATQQITAVVLPTNTINKTVTWSSSNTSVATVNSLGLVTGIVAGSAYITAKTQDGDKIATASINVSNELIIGSNVVGSMSEVGDNGHWIASNFIATSNMSVNRINLYVSQAAGIARLGIYTSNSSGAPAKLLAQTGDLTLINGWNSGTLATPQNLIAGATYWLAFEVSSPLTRLYYNKLYARSTYKEMAYGPMPSSAPLSKTGTGIYSIYADNNGLKSADFDESAMGTTGIEDLTEMVKIDVFPNPSKGNVTVRFSELPEVGSRIDIMDLSGRKITTRQITGTSEEFNLDQQPAGIYLVKSFLGSKEKTQKLIISK